jgi:hypothetical protein
MHDPLHHLLQQADATLARPPRAIPAETLLAASRHRRAQSKRRRIATVGVTAALASVAVAFTMSSRQLETPRQMRSVVKDASPPRIDIPAPRTPEELRQEIAALEREAAWRTEMLKSPEFSISNISSTSRDLADSERASAPSLSAASLNAPSLSNAEWVRVEAARTAALSWQYAHMAETEFHDIPAAVREYQRLVERFPGTTWAQRSQVSLDRILTSHNRPL